MRNLVTTNCDIFRHLGSKVWSLIAAIFLVVFAAPGLAQAEDCREIALGENDLAQRTDGLLAGYMDTAHVPGATIAIVHCGKIKLLRGYGYADLEQNERVDPDLTLFRIGSVSKTLTFVALMQLVETGQVEPDKPVNDYITQLHLPSYEGREILVRDLFAHRPGFEDRAVGVLFKRNTHGMIGMNDWLISARPELIRRPGERTVYSNYGATLAGMIIENVSGKPFHEYIEDRILSPLDMRSTSFREPGVPTGLPALNSELAAKISIGYRYRAGAYQPQPFTHIWQAAPAGSASSTSADMARFMMDILSGETLLSRMTVKRMQTRPYADHPSAPGFAWGFRTGWINGFPTLEHNGSAYTHFSALIMVPEQQVGVFVSVNGSDDQQVPFKLATKLLSMLIGESQAIPGWHEGKRLQPEAAQLHEGTYLIDRRSSSRLAKFLAMLIGERTVTAAGNGSLNIQGGSETGTYVSVAPGTFRDPRTGATLRFGYDGNGRASYMSSSYGHYGFDRVGWWQTFQASALILVFLILAALVHLAWWRPKELTREGHSRFPVTVMRIATIKALVALLFAVTLIWMVIQIGSMGELVAFEWPTSGIVMALGAQWVWLALVLVLLGLIVRGMKERTLRWHAIAWFTLVFLTDALVIAQLWQWNLITLSI